MKKKTKIILAAAALAIFSLTITAYQPKPQMPPNQPDVRPILARTESRRNNTPPPQYKAVVSDEQPKTNTQSEFFSEPIVAEPVSAQPTEKEISVSTTMPDTQTVTKPTAPSVSQSSEPKMGDTRIINGQKQSYFLGFGWVDDMGENEVIYCDGMYENGNKIGIMGSDGDINKMVGIMD